VFPTQNLHLVLDVLLAFLRCEPLVVLEFILYAEPPNPLSSYEHALADNSIGCPIHLPVESATAARELCACRCRPRALDVGSDVDLHGIAHGRGERAVVARGTFPRTHILWRC
jgi:hypothetical protein